MCEIRQKGLPEPNLTSLKNFLQTYKKRYSASSHSIQWQSASMPAFEVEFEEEEESGNDEQCSADTPQLSIPRIDQGAMEDVQQDSDNAIGEMVSPIVYASPQRFTACPLMQIRAVTGPSALDQSAPKIQVVFPHQVVKM